MKLYKHKESSYVWSFSKSNRQKSMEKLMSKTLTPAPDNYNPNYVSLKSFPKISFVKEKKLRSKTAVGPPVGKYNLRCEPGCDIPKLTFSAKFKSYSKANKFFFPAPASYNPNIDPIKLKFPQYTINPIKRNKSKKTVQVKNLGPLTYSVEGNFTNKHKSYQFSFSKDKKLSINKKLTTPAPNLYQIKSDLEVNTNPKYSINKLHTTKKKVENYKPIPGPGSYIKLSQGNDAPKVKMSFVKDFVKTSDMLTPSCDKYFPNIANLSTKLNPPKIR